MRRDPQLIDLFNGDQVPVFLVKNWKLSFCTRCYRGCGGFRGSKGFGGIRAVIESSRVEL
jgi:hypothetical protein